ncbi:hypothetical protein [Verminephrobacter aporrectodeae]|uniref:hypothetical protein n=1 Tax=Verminephrobacter aporrectodeae TaxID=1110389 RepID=UPI00111056EE|nr:hypothetical protein [Verminephrobacter aporrectodeae]
MKANGLTETAQHVEPGDFNDPNQAPLADDSATTTAVMTEVTKDLLDAKLEAIEVRMDARIASIEGKFNIMFSKMESMQEQFTEVRKEGKADAKMTRNIIIATGITVVFGIAAFNATVLSNMVASFDAGRNTALAIMDARVQAQQPTPPPAKPASH